MTDRDMQRIAFWVGWTAIGLTWGGCAESNPHVQSQPVPFELYDSPLVASNIRASDHTSGPVPGRENTEAASEPTQASPSSSSDAPRAEGTYDNSPHFGSVDSSADAPSEGVTPNPDAAQYVHDVYRANRVDLPPEARRDVSALYETCQSRDAFSTSGRPAAGDMVFFHNTTDANGDGRNNDWFTWVALVERPHDGDTPELIGYRHGSLQSIQMNRQHPDASSSNRRLRPPSGDDPPFSRHRAGELFAGYCSLLGDRREFILVDNWHPGMEVEPPSN